MVFKYSDIKPESEKPTFDTEHREYVPVEELIGTQIIADDVVFFKSRNYDCEGVFISFEDGTKYTTSLSATVVGKLNDEEIVTAIRTEGMGMTFIKRKSYTNKTREVVDFI